MTRLYASAIAFLVGLLPVLPATAQMLEPEPDSVAMQEMIAEYTGYIDSVLNTFEYRTGTVTLPSDIATISVPRGYSYIGPDDARTLLVDIWGNPDEGESLGMLIPSLAPTSDSLAYAVDISFIEEGHIDDDDAADLDYDELLEEMKEGTLAGNEARVEAGYEPLTLIGWAKAPYYDAARKRLHFAKEIKFGESDVNTLNYNVQFLNRRGYLNFNVIGGMEVVPAVDAKLEDMLAAVTFPEGERYSDFDATTDNIAAYGIGGLIAGSVLTKAGLFAKIGLFLAKGWKIILLAIAGVVAGIRKFFGGKAEEPPVASAAHEDQTVG